jgi:enoyl-[acyl-carrier protein] reductase II
MGINFFPSRYPIMCAVMNQVSDLNLALAVHQAGAMPSLQIDRYNKNRTINYDRVDYELGEFTKQAGNGHLVLVTAPEDLLDYQFLKLIGQYNISHVEILGNEIDSSVHWHRPQISVGIKLLKKTTKILTRTMSSATFNPWADAVCIKGKESAGFAGNVSVSELFDQYQAVVNTPLIPYGGIGTPAQVKNYIDRGAAGVAVGTMFAVTKESCLSEETKLSMCKATSANLTQFTDTKQNALVLGPLESSLQDWNHQHDLTKGIAGQGGLVYAGTAIDHVTSIRTVKQVVEYLTEELTC